MLRVVITAFQCNFRNTVICVSEQILGFYQSVMNNIIHTGNVKFLFVDELQVTAAYMELVCHVCYGPLVLRVGGNLST